MEFLNALSDLFVSIFDVLTAFNYLFFLVIGFFTFGVLSSLLSYFLKGSY